MNTGVLYIASGEEYITEARHSAKSVLDYTDVPVALLTDTPVDESVFDHIIRDENVAAHHGDAGQHLSKSPFDRTLYLDTDTYVTADISELFTLLDRFGVAAAHAPYRNVAPEAFSKNVNEALPDIPTAFPEYNRGVIAFDDSEETNAFLDSYRRIFRHHFEEYDISHDQVALRQALYQSNVRIATLPPEYNYRLTGPGYAQQRVKILHGRHPNLDQISTELNRSTTPRATHWSPGSPKDLIVVESDSSPVGRDRTAKQLTRQLLSTGRELAGTLLP